jgi:ELWxxDGT repeat protein
MLRFLRSRVHRKLRPRPASPRGIAPRLEELEIRLLPSLSAQLLSDINPTGNSSPSSFTGLGVGTSIFFLNPEVVFSSSDGVHGNELWGSNGTQSGTHMLMDVNPGSGGSYPQDLTALNSGAFFSSNDNAFFTANDGVHGRELWLSNGSSADTRLVADINPGGAGSYPQYLTNVFGTLFFSADDGVHGRELWRSDGNASGTSLVADLTPGTNPFTRKPYSSNPVDLTDVSGILFFAANVGGTAQLWRSDGTAAGTSMVADINPSGNSVSKYSDFTNVNGTLFFAATDGTHGNQLWRSDGTAGGTSMVADSNPTGDSSPMLLTNVGGTLFFAAEDGAHGFQVWRSDGTSSGTSMVADINAGAGGQGCFPHYLTNVNGILFFSAFDNIAGDELWRSDGTASGTGRVADINFGYPSSNPKFLTNVDGTLFFEANDGSSGIEPWESDGTAPGTKLIRDINPGGHNSFPSDGSFSVVNFAGMVFFSANDGVHGIEPWVVKDMPSTFLTSSPQPTVYGEAATFTASVIPDAGFSTPTGTATFHEGMTTLAAGVSLDANGQAAFSTASLSSGTHFITATYDGSFQFAGGSQSAAMAQSVLHDDTTTTLTSSVDPAVFGQPVTFTATVTAKAPGSGMPIGFVQFDEGTKVLYSTFLDTPSGQATFSTSALAVGSHTITAAYIGLANFNASQGNDSASPEVVNPQGTGSAVTSSPSPAVLGQSVTFTANVSMHGTGSVKPTGTVMFKEGSTILASSVPVNALGQATFVTSSLPLGSNTITVSYSGNSNFQASQATDSSAPEVVNKDPTRTVLTAFPDPGVFGQTISFTVAVSALPPASGTPTGTVTFTDGSTTIGSVTLNAGRATFTTAALSRGGHAITASYGGGSKFLASSYAGFGEIVQKDATTTTVAPSANPAGVGHTVTFTATVQANAPRSGRPTGTVIFKDITTVLGTKTLGPGGQATFSISSLPAGTHAITATYGGDNNFSPSISPIIAEVVKASAGTPTLAVSGNLPEPMPVFRGSLTSLKAATNDRLFSPGQDLRAQSADAFFASSGTRRRIIPRAVRPCSLGSPEDWVGP